MTIPQELSALIAPLLTQVNPYWLTPANYQDLINKFREYGNLPSPPYKEASNFMCDILPAHTFDDGTRILLRVPMAELLLLIKDAIDN